MSSLPFDHPDSEDGSLLFPRDLSDDSWLLLQEVLQEEGLPEDSVDRPEESPVIVETSLNDKVLEKSGIRRKARQKRNRRSIRVQTEKMVVQYNEEGESIAKKQDHNARERMRRMKLSGSFLALRALLPESRRSKKNWCAPVIIDRVLEYIPELETEIEKLRLMKDNVKSTSKDKQVLEPSLHLQLQLPTVSVNEVKKGEVIVQICMGGEQSKIFSDLVRHAEEEGARIISSSHLLICNDIMTYHLHVQVLIFHLNNAIFCSSLMNFVLIRHLSLQD
ncbi:hypothetical protein RJ639_007296 [Escallonia herrerae]|uniref:BHLH domain-containing protein n=1 Tax=Escallonia herrerae TaxID=1293975 RepID=A0AA88VVL9_9ASTE|nr:hypothetical protein RJ639_007296 [Escallonia herrerae]